MLYPKRKEKLTKELFQNPTNEYRCAPFWAWNCELKKDELHQQIDMMKQMGMGGAHMHVRTGMATPYLSDEYMDLIRSCVDKCKKEAMLAWLYDEDRWPSGAAGGIVTKEVKYRQRMLIFTQKLRDDTLLACYDVSLHPDGTLSHYAQIDVGQKAKAQKWYAYLQVAPSSPWYNNQAYINTLDPNAMKRFIEVTYERYWETVGDEFGKTIPAIFTDEPQFASKTPFSFADSSEDAVIPWTDDLPDTFADAYDEDLLAHLPEVFWDLPDQMPSRIRYHYHDHVCERFTRAFTEQCGDWCSKHGLMLTGHMMNESTLVGQTRDLGEVMRAYRNFELPGIDILRNYRELNTAKQAQSAVHQYGREGMLSELYGVTGWDFDFRGHKYQGDWQAALGVTVRVPHLFWVSMKGEAKRDYPASIGYQSPWWKDYNLVEDHFARVNTAMTRGKPLVRIGMIHPIESYWLAYGPREQSMDRRKQMDRNFSDVTEWMLGGLIDFDFISESLLPELCPAGHAPLSVGCMEYDTIIVPGCDTLRSTTLDRLESFSNAGGRLIFMGEAPRCCDAVLSDRGKALWEKSKRISFDRFSLMQALQTERLLDIRRNTGERTENLIHQFRQDGDDRWLFVAHNAQPKDKDISSPNTYMISLKGEYQIEEYDTCSGEIRPLAVTHRDGLTVIEKELYGYDSMLLRLTHEDVGDLIDVTESDGNTVSVPILVDFKLDEPNVLLLDKAEYALDDQPWQQQKELLRADNDLRDQLGWPQRKKDVTQPWALAEMVPEHRVRLRFTFDSWVETDVCLALEDSEIAEITYNGVACHKPADGWFVDKCIGIRPLGKTRVGENIIEVELPFGQRTNVEWCYLLGRFGVEIRGEYRVLTKMPDKIGFDDITRQGLVHYTGNITYCIPVKTKAGALSITVPHYAGIAVKVRCDGDQAAILYPPYRCQLSLSEGDHMLELTLLGNRYNAFGHLHCAEQSQDNINPDIWRYPNWTESYRLHPLGILSAPIIKQIENCIYKKKGGTE